MSYDWSSEPPVSVSDILFEDRVRSDMGEIDKLCDSIKEFGIIQPIVLAFDGSEAHEESNKVRLVAGGRRFTAIKRLGWKQLVHGRDFVFREEKYDAADHKTKLRFQGLELEENLRRKALTWQEEVLGKKRLLETMQALHGVAEIGGRTREERLTGVSSGFGVRKLASLLGESPAQVSQDLQLARGIEAMPALKSSQTKTDAMKTFTRVQSAVAMAANPALQKQVAESRAAVSRQLSYRVLVFVPDETAQASLIAELEARGLTCQPVIV